MSGLIECFFSNLNIDLLHTLAQGCAWILMQTGASTGADDGFYFLVTFTLSVMHWQSTYGGAFEKNDQYGYLSSALSFTVALLFTLNFDDSNANNVACLVMLWASFGLYAWDIAKKFISAE